MTTVRNLKREANGWLGETWLEMRNGTGRDRRAYFAGAADVLADIGLLGPEERDGWIARRDRCPGHDDEGGRDWCAYCGTLGPSPEGL